MTYKGKVVNCLPLDKPSRAIILLEEWPFPIEIPMHDLKYGQHVELRIDQIKVRGASASPLPILRPASL